MQLYMADDLVIGSQWRELGARIHLSYSPLPSILFPGRILLWSEGCLEFPVFDSVSLCWWDFLPVDWWLRHLCTSRLVNAEHRHVIPCSGLDCWEVHQPYEW
jgi:hypothetical protein